MLAKRAFFEGIENNEWSRTADQVLLVSSVNVGSSAGQPRHTFSSRPIGISLFKVIDTILPSVRSSMPRPKRNLLATAQETASPPAALDDNHAITRVRKAEGKNLYLVELPNHPDPLLVELPSRFRSQIWIKRGGYVLIDTAAFLDRDNKLDGEIVNVVREEKEWRKQSYWCVIIFPVEGVQAEYITRPPEFTKKPAYPEESEDEESTVGKMPPIDDSDGRDGS